MTVDILTLLAGDTTYVAKHNANYVAIKAAIEALQNITGGGGTSSAGGIQEIFDRDGIIGKNSYLTTVNGGDSKKVDVAAGAFFNNGTLSYLKSPSTVVLDFTGKSVALYYITLGTTTGVPTIETSQTSYSVYSVDWDGAAVVTNDIVLVTDILFDGDDYQDVLDGGPLGGPYESLAERLDDIENNIGGAGTGTSSLSWTLRQGYGGTPGDGDTALFEVERGTESDVAVRWNEQANKWQFTNDGSTWDDIPTSASGSATGTNETTWTVDEDNAGAAVETQLRFEGGSDDDVIIRATAARELQFSVDNGVTWHDFAGADGFNVGGGVTNRAYYKNIEAQVVNDNNLSDSAAWQNVDLTADFTEKGGSELVVAALLRVFYHDSAPATDTRVRFRKAGIAETPDQQAAVYAYDTAVQPAPEYITVPVSSGGAIEYWIEASGANTANLDVYLVGYIVELTGTGTQKVNFTAGAMVVNQGTSQTFDKLAWLDRGLVWFFQISQTGMSAGTFDVEIYADDGFTTLLYKAINIAYDATYPDSLPWFYEDEDATTELHIKITNAGTGNGTFTAVFKAERFA